MTPDQIAEFARVLMGMETDYQAAENIARLATALSLTVAERAIERGMDEGQIRTVFRQAENNALMYYQSFTLRKA